MKQIEATKGYVILCDEEDYESLSQFSWYAHNGSRGRRPARRASKDANGVRKVNLFHHAVVGKPPKGKVVDHINGDPWDNRRSNLRICTYGQNVRNQRRKPKHGGLMKGVFQSRSKYAATISYQYKAVRISGFETPREAALAYDALALFLHGEFACLNYPNAGTLPLSPEQVRQGLVNKRPSARVLTFLRKGMNATEAARAAACSISLARKVARKNGITLPTGRPVRTAA